MLAITATYAFLRFIIYKPPTTGDYLLTFNLSVIKNTFWYFVWLINLPEIFKSHISISELIVSRDLLTEIRPFIKWYSLSLIIFLVSSIIIIMNKSIPLLKIIIVLALFIASLAPVIFFKDHSYPYYLAIPSLIAYTLSATIFDKLIQINAINKAFVLSFAVSLLTISFLTVQFQRDTHWIDIEQKISKEAVDIVKNSYTYSETSITLPDSVQLKQSLMDQEGMKVILNDQSIRTIYTNSKK